MLKRLQPRQNIVSLLQMFSPGNQSELKLFRIIETKAIKNTNKREELYDSYGSESHSLMLGLTLKMKK